MPDGVVDVAEAPVDLRGQAMALHVLRTHLEDGVQLDQRGGQLPVGSENLDQDEPGRGVVREARQPIAAERDNLADAAGLAVEIGELGEGQGSGIARQPLFLPADGPHDSLIVDGHPKAVIRSARLGCQSRHGRHDPSDVMTDRTSVIGTSYTRRNAPMRGASTKGIRPSFAFLSRDIAPTTGSTSIAPACTGSPSASRSRSCRAAVSASATPSRRARRASATMPSETASPWVNRAYFVAASSA